ncbi:MAG TPA: hypothetical protein GX704_02545 [Clostridiales bacterium]|jgi:hypothetical protein|nr:hypothetical protein [Clostridiales bacterium]
MKKIISVVLAAVMVCAMSAFAFAADIPDMYLGQLNRVPECDSTTKYLEGYNLAIFKKGNTFVIWTDVELSFKNQAKLVDAIEAGGYPGLNNLRNPEFAFGFDTFKIGARDVTISIEGVIQFENKPTWSWFYRGVCWFSDQYIVE